MKRNFLWLFIVMFIVSTIACGTKGVTEAVDAESVEYWIDKMDNPDEVLMSLKEIQEQNKVMLEYWGTDWLSGYYDIQAFPESIEKTWLKDRICYLDLRNTKLYYKGEAVSEEQWDVYYDSMNLESIPEQRAIEYGVVIHNTPMRDIPTTDILTNSSMNEAENAVQQTTLKINEPVLVLWENEDWLYVAANEYFGWIEKKDCALLHSRQEWLDIQEQSEFLIVYEDDGVAEIETPLWMGTKLFLASVKEQENLSLSNENNYIVRIPEKDENGYLVYQYIEISKDNKVSEGYLPYTSANVLKLAFHELGEPYGWGGMDGKRDCSSYIKDIYSCFGFMMPRNSRIQMNIPLMAKDTTSMSVDDKEEYLASINPGAILGINGHVMLYIGRANEQYYVISMLGSYIPETVTEDFGNHVESVNKVFVNTLDVKRKNGNTWLQEIISVVELQCGR